MTEYGFAIYYASYHELDRHKERHPYQFSNIGEDWNEPLTEELIEKYYKKLTRYESTIFNNFGYPHINLETSELEWWVRKIDYKAIAQQYGAQ